MVDTVIGTKMNKTRSRYQGAYNLERGVVADTKEINYKKRQTDMLNTDLDNMLWKP